MNNTNNKMPYEIRQAQTINTIIVFKFQIMFVAFIIRLDFCVY